MLLRCGRICTYPNETLKHAFINASDFKISLLSFDKSLVEHICHPFNNLVDSVAYSNNLLIVGASKSSKGQLSIYKINLDGSSFDTINTFGETLGRPVRILPSKDNIIVLHSLGISIYNCISNNSYKKVNHISSTFNQIAISSHRPNTIATANQLVELLDLRNSSLFTGIKTGYCHRGNITYVDFNPNAENAIVTSGIDGHLAFWDIRKFERPLKIGKISDNWITSAIHNPFHDQLLIATDTSGCVKLITCEFEKISTTRVKSPVYNACWSCTDTWTYAFQDESYQSNGFQKVTVPRETKYNILLGDSIKTL
ncbi:Protein tssc1 homolog [Babesia microti strain RI]|uniref:Protein tssc1 homolog n=1 Tax=Babesia microti (strain RI) TaxID=1133968 RepID=I7J685_BABMR|nr:Protein tssc1 homolog [Babesia microti strain RI]CCF73572.1 Protein tssc1 homolog [Babesia microti strain RI]|eukprot:XP_012648181.1 Protein tssc1 homolog [Babesia microti strain RI]